MSIIIEKRDLVSEIVDAQRRNAPNNFQNIRDEALRSLNHLQLPGNKTEEYRFTPITRVLEKNFPSWPAEPVATQISSTDEYLIPGLDAFVIVLINGKFSADLSSTPHAGFTVSPIGEADSLLSEILFKEVNFKKDPLAALNTALWTEGIFIRARSGTTIEKPILLLQISDSTAGPISTHNRVAIILEKGTQLSLIEKSLTTGPHESFSTLVEEVVVKEHAKFEYCKIQKDGESIQVSHTGIRQYENSHVNTFTLTMDGKLVRNNLTIAIDGEKCESHFHGLYLLKDDMLGDNHTVVDHQKPNSFSNELYKGVMDGNSKGVFNGKIYVRPHAQKTNAFQSNRNILLTDKATINTKPQLEIWADDVKCSHGCTTGQLDEEALFYLKSRGIHRDTAKAMLLYAFAAETFQIISNEVLKAYVDSLISERLHKDF